MKKLEKKQKALSFVGTSFRPNLYDLLKVFAVMVMIIDHIGFYLFPEIIELRLIGRFAFPIFLFLVGFNGSYRWRRSLAIVALISELLMWFFARYAGYAYSQYGILFVIILVRFLLFQLQKININFGISLFFPLFVWFLFVTEYGEKAQIFLSNYLDYGVWGILLALSGFFAKRKDLSFFIGTIMLTILMGIFSFETIKHFRFYESWMRNVIFFGFCGLLFLFYLLIYARQKDKNLTLKTHSVLDQIFLFISHNALWIYGFHIMVIVLIFFIIK